MSDPQPDDFAWPSLIMGLVFLFATAGATCVFDNTDFLGGSIVSGVMVLNAIDFLTRPWVRP